MVQAFRPEFKQYTTRLLITAAVMQGIARTLGHDLPRHWPELAPRTEGVCRRDGFSVEQVSAEFWPGVRYALQVYVPQGGGPFPAVVMVRTGPHSPRHSLYQLLGGGLARLGILRRPGWWRWARGRPWR